MGALLWFIIAVIAFILESMTVSLVAIWFGISGIITAILSLFISSTVVQILIFMIVTVILLIFTRPAVKKYFKPKNTNSMSLIGEMGTVALAIDETGDSGQVKVGGNVWKAKSNDGVAIKEGTRVIIKEIKGVTLIVEERKDDK